MRRKVGTKGLLTESLEKVSRDIFKRYSSEITELIGNSPGIYALYDSSELYYIGKATDLRRRVKQHLVDRHVASWTHFSLYLVKKVEQIHEIESLVIRIANPDGNRAVPKGKDDVKLHKKLKRLIRIKQEEELERLLGRKKGRRKISMLSVGHPKKLAGLVNRKKKLYRTYKGKEYIAYLTPKGKILLGKKSFDSPTGAAKSIVDRRTVGGWDFWYIRESSGEWVRLSEYTGFNK